MLWKIQQFNVDSVEVLAKITRLYEYAETFPVFRGNLKLNATFNATLLIENTNLSVSDMTLPISFVMQDVAIHHIGKYLIKQCTNVTYFELFYKEV